MDVKLIARDTSPLPFARLDFDRRQNPNGG
jgi:hypothetical protein